MEKPVVIVDIDGTLADVRHRLHYLRGRRKDWGAFFHAMDRDTPIEGVVRWVQGLPPDYRVAIITGRPEQYREITAAWLRRQGIPSGELYMRPACDHRPDYVMKREVLRSLKGAPVAFAIDDRPQVCRMWRETGIRCFPIPSDEENQRVNDLSEKVRRSRRIAASLAQPCGTAAPGCADPPPRLIPPARLPPSRAHRSPDMPAVSRDRG